MAERRHSTSRVDHDAATAAGAGCLSRFVIYGLLIALRARST